MWRIIALIFGLLLVWALEIRAKEFFRHLKELKESIDKIKDEIAKARGEFTSKMREL